MHHAKYLLKTLKAQSRTKKENVFSLQNKPKMMQLSCKSLMCCNRTFKIQLLQHEPKNKEAFVLLLLGAGGYFLFPRTQLNEIYLISN